MIDINKKYQTRCGYEVNLFTVDGNAGPVIGEAKNSKGDWMILSWDKEGNSKNYDGVYYDLEEVVEIDYSLIEAGTRIKFKDSYEYLVVKNPDDFFFLVDMERGMLHLEGMKNVKNLISHYFANQKFEIVK